MNSTLMYSRVMLVTGTNNVVPGLLAFHWLKSNSPGRVVGNWARPSWSLTRARRNMSTRMSACCSSEQPRERRELTRLGHHPEDVEPPQALVVRPEQLRAVVRAGARPGAVGPLDQRRHAAHRIEVREGEPVQPGARHHQQRLLEFGQRDGLVRALVRDHFRPDRHAEPDAPALAVEDALEVRVGQRVGQAVRRALREPCSSGRSGFRRSSRMVSPAD